MNIFDSDTKIDKLLDAQGWAGFGVYFYLCQKAYGSDGYFYRWTYDDAASTARKMGGGMGSETVMNTVGLCLRIGLFDRNLFDRDGILTSKGIQRGYWTVLKSRPCKTVIREYWLLDADETPGIDFSAIKSNKSPTNSDLSPINADLSHSSVVYGSEVYGSEVGASPSSPSATPPITQDYLVQIYGKQLTDVYLAKAKKYKCTGDKAVLKAAEWMAADSNEGKIKPKNQKETSFDLDEYQALVDSFTPVYKKKK